MMGASYADTGRYGNLLAARGPNRLQPNSEASGRLRTPPPSCLALFFSVQATIFRRSTRSGFL